MLDLRVHRLTLDKTIAFCRDKGITLPTFRMMRDPERVPQSIKDRLQSTALWDLDPVNLYRISWKNEPRDHGGLFGDVNHLVLPPALSGCRADIVVLSGRFFPTGAHKVGATYGCLVPLLVTGQFDPRNTAAVWPSTGNYCRGGAYISALLACRAIAILPEGMSPERFEWLKQTAAEVIATPGCESNVKEIFDKCHELKRSGRDLRIFNQFDEPGNPMWHYAVTGPAVESVLAPHLAKGKRLAGYVAASGSGGTLGAGYYLKHVFPRSKLVAAEALQCPTLLLNGFGDHRIEGIGDKHVPWIHDLKSTDMVIAIDDDVPMRLLRLFNEAQGRRALQHQGLSPTLVDRLDLLGISGLANVAAAIKFAKYYELRQTDVVVTIATDSLDLYTSRLRELESLRGAYTAMDAAADIELLRQLSLDGTQELSYYDRKRIHNLKYFTWIEQQGKDLDELNAQWYDHDAYWQGIFQQVDAIDDLIDAFNQQVG